MSELNSHDRALLDGARAAHEPTEDDRARVRAALATRLGGGAGLATGTVVMSKTSVATTALTKLLLSAAMLATVATATAVIYRRTNSAPAEVAPAPSVAPLHDHTPAHDRDEASGSIEASSSEEVSTSGVPEPAVVPTSKPSVEPTTPRSRAMRAAPVDEAVARAPVATSDPPLASPPSPPSTPVQQPPVTASFARASDNAPSAPLARTTLEAEMSLVRDGVAALNAGDPARALALFDEHARAFAGGVFTEERAAERVVALRELRRCDDVRIAALEFLRDYPRSPLAARVRATCVSPNP